MSSSVGQPQLSTTESFLCGALAACVAVSGSRTFVNISGLGLLNNAWNTGDNIQPRGGQPLNQLHMNSITYSRGDR
jgi:hypothetical protein